MPTHKADLGLLSQSQLAFITKRAPATVRKCLDGIEPAKEDGKTRWFEPWEALPRIYGAGEGLDLTSERARLAKEQADAQEIKNAQLRGELIPQADVETMVVSLASGTAQRLRGVPSKAAALAHAAETIAEAEQVIRREVDAALEELADAAEDAVEESQPAGA